MEQNRQLRNLIPPLVFLISLVWIELYFGKGFLYDFISKFFSWLQINDSIKSPPNINYEIFSSIIGSIIAGGTLIIALGFIISSLSIFLLWLIFGGDWEYIGLENKRYEVDKFVHGKIYNENRGLFDWLDRRWNMFLVSIHCCTSLLLTFLIFVFYNAIKRKYSPPIASLWIFINLIISLIFGVNGFRAYANNHRMVNILMSKGDKWANCVFLEKIDKRLSNLINKVWFILKDFYNIFKK